MDDPLLLEDRKEKKVTTPFGDVSTENLKFISDELNSLLSEVKKNIGHRN